MSERPRALLVCPGGGPTGMAPPGSLADHPLIGAVDAMRLEYGLEPLAELNRTPFDPSRHLRPANAAPGLFVRTLLDAERVEEDLGIAVVVGSSVGWYAALAVSGALPIGDAFRLVQEVSLIREDAMRQGGGQVIYPLLDSRWRPSADARAAVADVLSDAGAGAHPAFESIDFGGFVVLAGDEAGVGRLLQQLPVVQVGERRFPLRLAMQGPDHTPLAEGVAEAAADRLSSLGWRAPRVPLVDGRGARWSPWSTDPASLRDHTLGAQLVEPYHFGVGLRVALREYAPDHVVVAGAGGGMMAIVGQVIVEEGYRGLRSRAAFEAAQRSARPLVLSVGAA
ncbi:MAG TPA: hypothetical protein VFK61_01985 [Candidatus Limnocylindria bacterium]|nr:hypothetical protein [Candidatus Limnocylindria bacterium]